jgi:non-specific protein-tyrosine kinase
MELTDYLKTIWKWLWLIILSTGVAAFFSWLAVRQQPPIYQAKATLMVGQAMRQAEPNQVDLYLAQTLAQTYTEIAQRQPVREATKAALGLTWLPGYAVTLVPGTQLLEIRVTDSDRARAAAVADELAKQLIAQSPTSSQADQAERRQFVDQQLDSLQRNIDDTSAEIEKLRAALGEMFSAREIADTQNQIALLQQKLNDLQANYGLLLNYTGEGAVNTLSIFEHAQVPAWPIGPNKSMTILTAAGIGLALALGTAFLLEYLDDTLKTPEDVTKATQLNTLAGISRIVGDRAMDKLVVVNHPKSPISEAYRVLRTNLQFSSLDRPLRTLLISSPNPVEGKSTTVANLGAVMAQAGNQVIIVDADLRRPSQHRLFGLENREGLTTLLLSDEPCLNGHLQQTAVENLRVLSTGPLPPNPSELLGSHRMTALVERLKEEADVVLFDSPPSLAVTDASVLAAQTDGVVLVAQWGRTRRSYAEQTSARLRQVGANLVGVVLNQLRPGRGRYYYYYYSHYGDYYGYGNVKHKRRQGLARLLTRRHGHSKS